MNLFCAIIDDLVRISEVFVKFKSGINEIKLIPILYAIIRNDLINISEQITYRLRLNAGYFL